MTKIVFVKQPLTLPGSANLAVLNTCNIVHSELLENCHNWETFYCETYYTLGNILDTNNLKSLENLIDTKKL